LRSIVEWKNLVASGVYKLSERISFKELWIGPCISGAKLSGYIGILRQCWKELSKKKGRLLFRAQLGALPICISALSVYVLFVRLASFARSERLFAKNSTMWSAW